MLNSQSNHTGIETYQWPINICRSCVTPNRTILELKQLKEEIENTIEEFSQSNHTGIETESFVKAMTENKDSQSNHTGIETVMKMPNAAVIHSPNRTILELKPLIS